MGSIEADGARMLEGMVAVLPCADVLRTRAFYERLGFRQTGGDEQYALLETGGGARLHLRFAREELDGRQGNAGGVYLFAKNVDELSERFAGSLLGAGRPQVTSWNTYEFALSDPDGALVRVGWPLMSESATGAGL